MGGCSSINGMIYMRGQANDYDQFFESQIRLESYAIHFSIERGLEQSFWREGEKKKMESPEEGGRREEKREEEKDEQRRREVGDESGGSPADVEEGAVEVERAMQLETKVKSLARPEDREEDGGGGEDVVRSMLQHKELILQLCCFGSVSRKSVRWGV